MALAGEPVEDVDLVQQRRIADDYGVRLGDRLARSDRMFVDPAERDDGRTGPLGAEGGKGLSMRAVEERGDGQQLGRGDDPLSSSAMKPCRELLRPNLRSTDWGVNR